MTSITDHDKAEVALGKGTLRPFPAAQYQKNTTVGATTAAAGDLSGAETAQAEYSAVGAAALTTRTAAQMVTDSGLQPLDCYALSIFNSSAGITTLTAGVGVTIVGTATIAAGATSWWNVKVNADLSITITRAG